MTIQPLKSHATCTRINAGGLLTSHAFRSGKAMSAAALISAMLSVLFLAGCRSSNRSVIQDMIRHENLDFGRKVVSGRILAHDGSPLAGVLMRLESGLLIEESISDINGYYSFPPVPENEYTLSAQADGYSMWSAPFDTSHRIIQNITLTAAEGFVPANSITGRVVEYTPGAVSRPVRDAVVRSGNKSAITNNNGVFALAGLEPSSMVSMLATATGFFSEAVDVETMADAATVNVTINMKRRSGAAVFTVTSQDERLPVANADISMFSGVSEQSASGRTGSDGKARIYDLPVGDWEIIVRASGYEIAFSEVVLREGENVLDLELKPEPAVIIGRVLDRDTGSGISNVFVRVKGGATDNYAWTAANGEFEIYNVAPGSYYLEFIHAHYSNPVPRRLVQVEAGVNTTVKAGDFTLTSVAGSGKASFIVMISGEGGKIVPLPAGSWADRTMTARLKRRHGGVSLPVDLSDRMLQGAGDITIDTLPPGDYMLDIWFADTRTDAGSPGGSATGVYHASEEFTLASGSAYESLLTLRLEN